ncbi:FAD/NAD(P)-binding protein [Compostimonas suwonensis]|uniref:FAD-NAD(P)-binding protein n=1 Tax=Compostimonas suwonensis TaxID=1048394 RepID=A0A2M9BWJ4_9MICO|nr:FAD/NAD(P)-binding protein [Compostimonas suwonensis]PJJ62322.1 FAD-NAD(P)-binding protein [Compostimonas suwonensis]
MTAIDPRTQPLRLAVLGAGPRGVGFLERLAASHPLLGEGRDVVVHLVDPYPAGPGRIWRLDQSPLLKLNSMAQDVTMFTDESSTIDGPVIPGPSLIDWARDVVSGRIADVAVPDDRLLAELRALEGTSFPTRRLQSLYLDWFHRRTVEALGESVVVREHREAASRVVEASDGEQHVLLESGKRLDVDVVLYALGHNGREPSEEHRGLQAFAARHELLYVAPAFTADAELRAINPGQRVLVRGLGLAAVDLVVLLTEGRGGRFERDAEGRLEYRASGREPHLAIGSGRGVPYHSKIGSTLHAPRPEPRFFTTDAAARLVAEHDPLDFRRRVWPLIAKEMLWGYYWELFHGHPERVGAPWSEFARVLESYEWNSAELRAVVDTVVPDPLDRLHLDEFDRPLDRRRFADAGELQEALREYIETDLALRTRPEHSATLGLFHSLLQSMFVLGEIVDTARWSARSRVHDLGESWIRYFSYVASGPPAHRLEELLALSRAGIVEFLGSGMTVVADETAGVFRARGANTDAETVASALVDARLPAENVSLSDNPVLRALVESGVGVEELVADEEYAGTTGRLAVRVQDARILAAAGGAHERRFAIGPYTTAPFVGAFARPRTNAVSFRENDRAARAVLLRLVEIARERESASSASAAVFEPATI